MARGWFYNIPYHGHVNPTLPLMRELVKRGDEITYFSAPAFADRVRATGAIHRNYANPDAFGQTRHVTHAIYQGALVAESAHVLLPEVLALRDFDGALIGSMFMRSDAIARTVSETVSVARGVIG